MSDIAVIGMACKFPHAKDLSALWRVVRTGEVTFEDIPEERWNHASFFDATDLRAADKTYVRKGAFVEGYKEFAALHYGLAPRRVQVMDPQHRLLIEAVRQAIQDAGYDGKSFDRANAGVFVGASVSEHKDLLISRVRAQQTIDGQFGDKLSTSEAEALRASVADVVPMRAFSIAGSLLNMGAASISQTFDLGGPSWSMDAACSSALVAIHEAVINLRAGQCSVAFAGGVYLNLQPDNLIGFSRIGAISPSGVCRPFDARADGFVMGEGVGMVMLKKLEDARRDGDRIWAVIKGSGCNNDGRGDGPMTPRAEGQIAAMGRAHRDLDFPVETIGFVETHGTATTVGDATEVGALKSFFQARAKTPLDEPYCYLSSIKANIGHTMSAAGVAGFIKAALVLHHRTIPPQPSCEELNPSLELESSPFQIAQSELDWKASPKHPRRAAVSSFGFGGTNAHVLLEEAPPVSSSEVEHPQLFCFSAANEDLLRTYAAEVAEQIATLQLSCADVALTLAQRQSFDVRLAIVAQGRAQLIERLEAFVKGEDSGTFGTVLDASARQVAFLFPGQGAQRVGLLRDVVSRFPAVARRLKSLDGAVQHDAGASLLAALYPAEPYDEVEAQALLTRTEVCQPAMAALGLALGQWLKELGVEPTVVLGHSLGEFVASSVAGMLPAEDAVRLVARRGQLMNKLGLKDPGAMLAVMAERTLVEPLLAGLNNVWLANHNHPTQLVLSGHTASIAAAKKKLEANGLKTAQLEVSHAFHSPLMEGVDDGMRRIVARLVLSPPATAIASCISGGLYTSVDEARDIWVDHATAPVDFVSALETVVAQGCKLFIQVGAGNTLLSFARGAAGKDSAFFSLGSAEGGDGGAQLLTTLAQLWVRGVPLNAAALLEGSDARLVMLPPSPLETQTYWGIERPAQRAPRTVAPARPSAPSARPSSFSATKTGAPMDSLVSLFREQMALLTQQGEILKAQAAALQAVASGNPGAAASLAAAQKLPVAIKPPNFSNMVAPKEPRPPVVEDVRPQVEAKILASVARISAFPAAALKMEQALTGELGFDSLMLVELDGDVAKAWPKLGGLPRELFNKTTTIAAVINHIVGALAKPTELTVDSKSTAPISRYVPVALAAPLRPLRESVLSFDRPVLITVDAHGVGKALATRLTARGIEAVLGDATTAGSFAGVIHLADLTPRDNDYRVATRRVLAMANKVGPEARLFLTVAALGGRLSSAGGGREALGQVGALAFTRALAQEWPDAVVKAIDVELALGAEAIAQALFDELVSADRRVEVGYSSGGRVTSELKEARASGPVAAALDAQSVVLVTGGARGLGLKFARALGSKYHCAIVLAGRSAASDETLKACASVKSDGARECSYQVLDARSTKSVNDGVAAVKAAFGKIDAIVHAAGVIADSLVAKKDAAGLDAVLEPKVGGAIALLDATSALKLFVGVGSWAGRFGNAGQTDYASANAMLAALSQRTRPSVRCVTIDFPPWEDSAMAQRIPGFKKREMIEQGVTFLTDEEGLASFLTEVERGTGEVLIGREVTAPSAHHVSKFPVSPKTHVYLDDHQMAGQRVLPLAAAVDHLAAAALDARGGTEGFSIEDFKLLKPVLVNDTLWLSADVAQSAEGQRVTLRQAGTDSYRGLVRAAVDAKELPPVPQLPAYDSLPMSLEEFYSGFTFHGPRLRGIVSIEGLTETGVSGWVKGCRPSDWVKDPLRSAWTVDPLLLDSSFQLAGYWAWVKHQRAGFPLGFKRFTQLHPFGAAPVLCTAVFEAATGDLMRGTLSWTDSSGKLLAVMEGVEAEFKQRDPQFVAAAAAKKAPEAAASEAEAPGREGAADESTYRFDKFPEYTELQERIEMAAAFGLKNPYFSVHEAICGDTTVVNGKSMINFSSYNYVGNSGDPVVSTAAKAAIDTYGTSVSASRVASGEKPLTGELERELARFFGTESSLVFVSGHATNVTVIGHIVGPGDLILHDALAHDSIIGGARLSGAKRRPFPHNDFEALDRALTSLRPHYRRVLVCIEGTYSMDGDIPDLPKFIAVKKKHQALLLVDEAHSAGVIGKTGHGIGEYYDVVRSDVDLWMGTLSKSFASCGGYIAGTTALVEYLKYTTPGFVYSVGISPPNAAAALAALRQLEAHPERVKRLQNNAKLFLKLLKERDIDTGLSKDSAVVPAIVGNSVLCLQLSDALKDRGINVQPILYPAVEEHLARLRFFVSSLHSEEQLKKTADIVSAELKRLTREMEAVA